MLQTIEEEWLLGLQNKANEIGAEIYFIPQLEIDHTLLYDEIITKAGFPLDETNRVQYSDLPTHGKSTLNAVLIRGLQQKYDFDGAVKWGLKQELKRSTLCTSLAIPEKYHILPPELQIAKKFFIAETTGGLYDNSGCKSALAVWYVDDRQVTQPLWESHFDLFDGWLVFEK